MRRVLTAAQMRAVDAAAGRLGVAPAVLMENAGRAVARAAEAVAAPQGQFFVVCGPGNNGGDGLVAARVLAAAGRTVRVTLVGDKGALQAEPRDAALALEAQGVGLQALPAEVQARPGDVVIDALLGTGLSRPPGGELARAIEAIAGLRGAGAHVLAVDVPSGLGADGGAPSGPCVQADSTVTFAYLKPAHAQAPGRCGPITLADIGIPRRAEEAIEPPWPALYQVEEADARARVPVRAPAAHKGTAGHVLVVGGSPGKTGAAALCALGALRGGAGLVTVAGRAEVVGPVLGHAPEVMGELLPGEGTLGPGDAPALLGLRLGREALVVGPGLWRGPDTLALLKELLRQPGCPVVLDADALNAMAGRPGEVLAGAAAPVVLTPHPGELGRLLGLTAAQVNEDRVGRARQLALALRATVVLKGAATVVAAPDGAAYLNSTGTPALATAGTGDVLAGLIGALLGQGVAPTDAALAGVYAHGLAGELCARRSGVAGLLASDLLQGLQEVWVRWSR